MSNLEIKIDDISNQVSEQGDHEPKVKVEHNGFDAAGSVVFVKIPSDISYRPALVLRQESPLPHDERLVKYFEDDSIGAVKLAFMFEFSVEGELFNQLKLQSDEFSRDIGVVKAIEYLGKDRSLLQTPAKTPVKSRPTIDFNMGKEEFLKELYDFMERKGQPIMKLPSLGYQELDLYKLYRLVIQRGGMDQVTRDQEWKSVYQELGIPTMSTSASYNTRTNYKKFLYLYELEHFEPPTLTDDTPSKFLFEVGQFVRIVSPMLEGTVFYAQVLKKRFQGINTYYVHYNGWSNSHDEWMPESVMSNLSEEESINPKSLVNPSPSRSSKSNHIVYDPLIAEKHYHPRHKRTNSKKSDSEEYSTPSPMKRVRSGDFPKISSPSSASTKDKDASGKVRLKLRSRLSDLFEKAADTTPVISSRLAPLEREQYFEAGHVPRKRISKKNLHTFDFYNRKALDFTDIIDTIQPISKGRSQRKATLAVPLKASRIEKNDKYMSQVDPKYVDKRSLVQTRKSIAELMEKYAEAKKLFESQVSVVKSLKAKIRDQQEINSGH